MGNKFYLFILSILCNISISYLTVIKFANMGPFETKLKQLVDCPLPPSAMDKEHITAHNFSIYKTSTGMRCLRGDFTVPKTTKFKANLQTYLLTGGEYKTINKMDNLNCDHMIVGLLYSLMNVTIAKHECVLEPGKYSFEKLDVDYLIHTLVDKLFYGQLRFDMTFFTDVGVTMCVRLIAEARPPVDRSYVKSNKGRK